MNKQELKKTLTPLQYKVTQESGTEPPYNNQYYSCKEKGVFNCLICQTPLFDSETKYDSGCGWPAFWDQMNGANIKKISDTSHGMIRTQVRCGKCGSHLGHLFNDGPKDKSGKRYCINSASLKLEKRQ